MWRAQVRAGAAFGVLLKINDAGTLQWSRRLISGANLNSLKSLAVDAGADQAYVLTEQQRVIKYNSNGAQLFNRLIPLPTPSLGGMYNYITTDGRPGQMASKVILGGTNTYKKYYYSLPDSNHFSSGIRVIRSLNLSNGAKLSTDKFIIDCSYNYIKATSVSFSTKLIKINSNVTPTQMVALMDGSCNAPDADWYWRYGVARCFDLGNGSRHSNDNENLETGITLFPTLQRHHHN
ncbi:MAG: hypothetical protein IPP29_19270 [Bacteroidetes bacterium]|nr:hypothetical protein [Bacteroidota bacterium]